MVLKKPDVFESAKQALKETKLKHKVKSTTIRELRDMNIDTQPVGQRLPVSSSKDGNYKSVSIIETIFNGVQIGMITVMAMKRKSRRKLMSNESDFDFESIDGGHRKRAILAYLNNEFRVNNKFFRELDKETQEEFLNLKLSFCYYDYLDNETKGKIFRTLNTTTDVNFIEMCNSYGDIPIANLVRQTSRLVKGINNSYHELFEYTKSKKDTVNFRYLNFDNDRLRIDHMVARILYRYYASGAELLGGASDNDIEGMYNDTKIDYTQTEMFKVKLYNHLDFLVLMANHRKIKYKKGLSQHDFKVLSYLYFYILDNYGSVNLKEAEEFFEKFAAANGKLLNKEGQYKDVPHSVSGYTVPVMYSKYIGAPGHTGKIKMALQYLIKEWGDIESFLDIRHTKRTFNTMEKETKLAEQEFVCAVDGELLNMSDAHAAHIIAHSNGGETVYSNLVMVRAIYNQEMGTMNFDDYMKTRIQAA